LTFEVIQFYQQIMNKLSSLIPFKIILYEFIDKYDFLYNVNMFIKKACCFTVNIVFIISSILCEIIISS